MKGFAEKIYQVIVVPVNFEKAITPVLVAPLRDGFWVDISSGAKSTTANPDSLRDWAKRHCEIRKIRCLKTGRVFDAISIIDYTVWLPNPESLLGEDRVRSLLADDPTDSMVKTAESEGRDYVELSNTRVRFHRAEQGAILFDRNDMAEAVRQQIGPRILNFFEPHESPN